MTAVAFESMCRYFSTVDEHWQRRYG